MATFRSIAARSLRLLGVLAEGETPTASQASDALEAYNSMADQWNVDRLQIPVILPSRLTLVNGIGAYRLSPVTADAETEDDFDATSWSGFPPGWTLTKTVNTQVARDTLLVQTAPNAVLITATADGDDATLYQDFICDAGAKCSISIWMTEDSAGTPGDPIGTVKVQNLDNGLYLSSDGTWGTAVANLFEATDNGVLGPYVHSSLTFYLDPNAIIGDTLRVSLQFEGRDSNQTCHYDTFDFINYADIRARPVYIDHINYIDSNNNDELEIPLQGLTDDAWASVRLKPQTSPLPIYYYYNPTFPYGSLHVWPVPTGDNVSLIVYAAYPITKFSSTTQTFYLPPGYERMITTNLALELAPEYGATPSPLLMRQAQDSMDSVKRGNVKMSDLHFDPAILGGSGRGWYDIRTG